MKSFTLLAALLMSLSSLSADDQTALETLRSQATAGDKNFWRSDHYGALFKGVLSRPTFVIENPTPKS